jgi:hypothetical protein
MQRLLLFKIPYLDEKAWNVLRMMTMAEQQGPAEFPRAFRFRRVA